MLLFFPNNLQSFLLPILPTDFLLFLFQPYLLDNFVVISSFNIMQTISIYSLLFFSVSSDTPKFLFIHSFPIISNLITLHCIYFSIVVSATFICISYFLLSGQNYFVCLEQNKNHIHLSSRYDQKWCKHYRALVPYWLYTATHRLLVMEYAKGGSGSPLRRGRGDFGVWTKKLSITILFFMTFLLLTQST